MKRLVWTLMKMAEHGKCIFDEYLSVLRNSLDSLRLNVLICRLFSHFDRFIPRMLWNCVRPTTHSKQWWVNWNIYYANGNRATKWNWWLGSLSTHLRIRIGNVFASYIPDLVTEERKGKNESKSEFESTTAGAHWYNIMHYNAKFSIIKWASKKKRSD